MIEPKILITLNAEIARVKGCYFIQKNTGEFVTEIKELDLDCAFVGKFVELTTETL